LPDPPGISPSRRTRYASTRLVLWLLGAAALIVLMDDDALWHGLWVLLPDTRFDSYPWVTGGMKFVDLTFGLVLVALHEEIFFRRVARVVFRPLGDGVWMVLASAFVFGLFHWWTSLPNMLTATVAGAFLMLLYRRAGALWPAVLCHYVIDLWVLI
jgi:uncharacterized protein